MERFVVECMMSQGVPRANATALAEVLVAADVRGHTSHGIYRLDMYVCEVMRKICDGHATPTIIKESVSTALVDGNNGLGPVVSNFCMDLAIKKAKATGIGWVCVKGSNHFGIAGWYPMTAVKHGLIGMSFTNTSSLVVPTHGKNNIMGTNPISVAAPAIGDDSFVLDMATSMVSSGKLEIAHLKNQPIPEGWALNKHGKPTTDPKEMLDDGSLLPLGGTELYSGYKGFGLGMMVEIFCGILSGAPYAHNIRTWTKSTGPADLSHCFVALNPAFFANGFEDRMSDLMDHCRGEEPDEGGKAIQVAGDPERAHTQKVKEDGGITYPITLVKTLWQLAKHLDVTPMQSA